jgi:hypothetical protein
MLSHNDKVLSFLVVSRIGNPTYKPEPAEGSAAASRITILITTTFLVAKDHFEKLYLGSNK